MSGAVVWFTGLPSSGKTTLAERTRLALRRRNRAVCLLDGDAVREALVPKTAYDEAGRDAFYETLARLAALLAREDLVVLVAATAHRRTYRARARSLAQRFVEVYVATPAETCRCRDPKGLWSAADRGLLTGLPGADVAYEVPERADVTATSGEDAFAIEEILARVAER